MKAGYSATTANSQCSRLLGNVEVQAKIKEIKTQIAQELQAKLVREASTAFDVLVSIMNNDKAKDADRIKCAIDVMDRAGYVAQQRVEVTTNVSEKLDEIISQLGGEGLTE